MERVKDASSTASHMCAHTAGASALDHPPFVGRSMGPAPRTLSLLPLLLTLTLTLLLPLSSASEPQVAPRQADCADTTCAACLGSNVQCAWCYSGSKGQQCYNTVTGTCEGLTLRYSCVQEVRHRPRPLSPR